MMSYSFRDKPRTKLSDRLRGKSGDELLQELRQEFDKDRTTFFDSNPNWGFTPAGSAFPRRHMFDDDVDEVLRTPGRGRTDLRAHLDDLARRHPEFAEHLRSPPGWVSDFHSSSGGGGGSSSGHFAGSFGGSGSQESGFFDDKGRSSPEGNKQNQQQRHNPQPAAEEKQRRSPSENIQGSKTSGNYSSVPHSGIRDILSQHGLRNTDPEIGLKGQAAVKEERNQRSMSAPPDGRTQSNSEKPHRFVSKIEINPVNPATGETAGPAHPENSSGKPPMAPPKQQPQQPNQGAPSQHKQSTVRHIPIFVEGRDEPVLPKNIDQDYTIPVSKASPQFSSPHPQQQQFHPQHPQRKPSQQHQPQPNRQQQHHQQQPPPPHQQESRENFNQQTQQQPQVSQPQAEKKQQVNNDPMYQIQLVQDEVNELRKTIDNFKGTSRTDKEFIYLDEMLTRNLIKLDVIETEGKENVRAARKETIKSIQQCISLLESKVPQTPITQTPSSTNVNEVSESKMDVDEDKTKNESSDGNGSKDKQNNSAGEQPSGGEQKMEIDPLPVGQNVNSTNGNKMIIEEQQKTTSENQSSQTNTETKNKPADNVNQKDKNIDNTDAANPNEIKC